MINKDHHIRSNT